ncbi:MAG TPA: DHH family phosphoesterase [Candidatus Saccharimonadia bacterium]|jgi:nanoRNase/pAp phosphatase (c-di-AMP/oligoRNAs hydrolase)
MDLTPKQQTSEAIRQAETILVTTAQHPSVDQVAAVIGLTQILQKFGKKVTAVVSDSLPPAVQVLDTAAIERQPAGQRDFVLKVDVSKAEVDKLRYEVQDGKLHIFITPFKGGFAPSDVTFDYGTFHYDLAIVLGVPTRARLDRIYEQNQQTFADIPVVNIDFHRSNENYGAVNLIEPNASSLCEMLVALSESLQGGLLDEQMATTLLMGIVASTDRFTAAHTTSKSLTVAAQMMAAGARQQAVVKALYRDNKGGDQNQRGERNERQRDGRPAGNSGGMGRDGRGSERSERNLERNNERNERREQPVRETDVRMPEAVRPVVPEILHDNAPVMTGPVEQSAEPTVAGPVMPEQNARSRGPELPIIDPGHIELSEPEEVPEQMAQEPEASMPPMADFAAAAEILARRHVENETEDSGK